MFKKTINYIYTQDFIFFHKRVCLWKSLSFTFFTPTNPFNYHHIEYIFDPQINYFTHKDFYLRKLFKINF